MRIIDILIESALLLGLNDEANALKVITDETIQEIIAEHPKIQNLFDLSNFAIRELCTNYIPVVNRVEVETTEKAYPLNQLTNFIRVQNVFKNGEMINFKIINRSIILETDGVIEIIYETYPNILNIFDEIDFLENFSPDVLVFGLCSYYSIANGMFDEFNEFHEQYVNKAESLKNLKSLRNFNTPIRRWE